MERTSSFRSDSQTSEFFKSHAGMEECIANCAECFQVCTRLIPHCLHLGGEHAGAEHINLLSICAAICETSVRFMLAESEFHEDTCAVCAKVCDACADDCERIDGGDYMMKECIEICRECAESCRKMASHSH
ncbi:four-helix bundle copper-binding protein [Bdellovibrio sp. BCCA]|uniref:four-helix bundle copper-binding protein n=1 Tax=unclassified Bdellovibrio TaxID=2633795 RepID=UPI0025F3DF28|nr:four-helix bundle copper-binding protein [uncultured Bdellovibrio sp.]